MIHNGTCHCGFIKFTVNAEIDHARQCNCSICSKRGTLNFRVEELDLDIQTPLNQLTVYQWGSMTAEDYFCPHCGILAFRKPSTLTTEEIAQGKTPFSGWAINVRCIQGLNIDTLAIVKIDGAAL